MCRAEIAPAVCQPLAQLLADMGRVLAEQAGVPAVEVLIGPVDFGPDPAALGASS